MFPDQALRQKKGFTVDYSLLPGSGKISGGGTGSVHVKCCLGGIVGRLEGEDRNGPPSLRGSEGFRRYLGGCKTGRRRKVGGCLLQGGAPISACKRGAERFARRAPSQVRASGHVLCCVVVMVYFVGLPIHLMQNSCRLKRGRATGRSFIGPCGEGWREEIEIRVVEGRATGRPSPRAGHAARAEKGRSVTRGSG
jgi:hypothetical protein